MNEGMNKNQETKDSLLWETMNTNFDKKLESFLDFYKKNGVEVPEDFAEKIKSLWEKNKEEIKKQIELKKFDELIIAPPMVHPGETTNEKFIDLLQKMKIGDGYDFDHKPILFRGEPFKEEEKIEAGGYRSDYCRIILTYKEQNIINNSLTKETLGKEVGSLLANYGNDNAHPLTLEEYLIFQKKYFEETGNHLDDDENLICLSSYPVTENGNYLGRQVVAGWNKENNKLNLETYYRYNQKDHSGMSNPRLGTRRAYRIV